MFTRTQTTKPARLAAALLVLGLTAAAPAQTTWYVDDDADPGGDGMSWPTAFKYLQDALAVANAGDEIHVGQGIYQPDRDADNPDGTGNRLATFQLISGVALYGGYRGLSGGGDPDDRDIAAYETVLSGDLTGNDGPDFVNNDENSYHVVTGSGCDDTSVLDGFTITAGNASSGPLHGLAVRCKTVAPDLRVRRTGVPGVKTSDSEVRRYGSWASEGFCTGLLGGGMENRDSGSPTVSNCLFIGNSASYGGGGLAYSGPSIPKLANCVFRGNIVTGDDGGGIFATNAASPVVVNCVFAENSVNGGGGGMFVYYCGSPTLVGCVFTGNTARGAGGMFYEAGNDSRMVLVNCTFSNNSADYGGGLSCGRSYGSGSGALINCVFAGNASVASGGGAMRVTGGEGLSVTLHNCTLAANSAPRGNALACDSSDGPSEIAITNTIFWNGGDEVWNNDSSAIIITYSDVQDGWAGDGYNNINANPLFVDPDIEDYQLLPGSPCIDAGCNGGVPPDWTDLDGDGNTSEVTPLDLDGEGRFFDDLDTPDTGCGCPPIVDMGAYEFGDTGPQPCPGDLDCDRHVGQPDLGILLAAWETSDEGDLDCDGLTDQSDLGILLAHWGEGCP